MFSSPELLTTFLERWNAHNVDGIVDLYHSDAVMTDPTLEQPLQGRADLRNYYATMWGASPRARLECESFVEAVRSIVWLWRFSPGGQDHQVVGATHFRVADGRIAADDAIWDPNGL